MKKQIKYSPEVRERAVRLLREHQGVNQHAKITRGWVKSTSGYYEESSVHVC